MTRRSANLCAIVALYLAARAVSCNLDWHEHAGPCSAQH
jgi:hypothetical protein